MEAKHTPGPWEYVPGTENHGPYVTSDFGNTIADLYTMSRPEPWRREDPKPIPFMHEMAEANARLIAASPDLLSACVELMPTNICTTNANVLDGTIVTVDVTMGELRRLAAAIARATGAGE